MVFDKPPNQIEAIKLFAPVIIVGQIFYNFFDGRVNVVKRRKFIFGRIVGCLVVDLVGFLFGGRGRLLNRERLFRDGSGH